MREPLAFLKELLLEDKSLFIACVCVCGGGGGGGEIKVDRMVLRWGQKGDQSSPTEYKRGVG